MIVRENKFSFSLPYFLEVEFCFHGAACLLVTVLTFTGAMSSIIFTIFEFKLFGKLSTESDNLLQTLEDACSKRVPV